MGAMDPLHAEILAMKAGLEADVSLLKQILHKLLISCMTSRMQITRGWTLYLSVNALILRFGNRL